MSVNQVRTLVVNAFGIGCNDFACYLACDFKHFLVRVHSVLVVERSVVEFFAIGVVAFFQSNDFLHQRVVQMVLQVFIVVIKISHLFGVGFT